MAGQKVINRWLIVAAAVIEQISVGILYAWSVFRPAFERDFGWSKVETGYPFQVSLFFFAIGVILGGRIQDRIGPRKVTLVGGVIMGLAAVLTGIFARSVPAVVIAYGMLGGLGVGFSYVTPIATLVKWFPDKRGLVTGLAVFGIGVSTVVFAPVITALIGAVGISGCFYVLAAILVVMVCGFGSFFRVPPAGWAPEGWKPSLAESENHKADFTLGTTLRTWQFWLLWLVYFLGAGAGVMIIGKAKPLGLDMAHVSDSLATVGVMLLGVLNAAGRFVWGTVSDRIGRLRTLQVVFFLYVVTFLGLLPWENNAATWLIGICLAGFCYGGFLAVMPSLMADYYGTKHHGANYGAVFTGYGAASVLWPFFLDKINVATGGFVTMWYIAAAGALVGLVLAALVRRPETPVSAAHKSIVSS